MSAFVDVGGRLGSDVIQLVSVLRQIAIKTCVVFSVGLLASVAAFVVRRRLEPDVSLTITTAAAREEPPGTQPAQRSEDVVTSTITSDACSSGDGRITGTSTVADRTNCIDTKTTHRMPFSETHV